MIAWILVVFVTGTTDYDVWGGYTRLDACQRTVAQLEQKYSRKLEDLRAECWPVSATFKDQKPGQFYQKP